MIRDYFNIAWKSVTRRGIRSWLTMLGIFIGIAAVVSLISLGAGLKLAVAQQFNILGAERITIQAKGIGGGPPGLNVANPLTDDDLKVIQRVRGVDIAAGRLIVPATVVVNNEIYNTYIGSTPKNKDEKEWINEISNLDIEFGRELKSTDKNKITIGNDYHTKKSFGKNLNLGDSIEINGQNFEIVGIHEKKGAFTVDGVIAMNEEVMRELFNEPTDYSIVAVKASDTKEMDETVERINKALRKERNLDEGKEDFTTQTSVQSLNSISQTLDIVTILLSGIAAISLFVGGIGIMNTMYTAVLERQADIGIMKAIGGKNKDIFMMFFIESGFLGLAGGIIGILLGIGIGKFVEFIGTVALGSNLLKASFSPELLIGALLFSFIVGAAAGTLPALGAAKMNPVDALRD
ncbi:ABC transporter permease [Candidatus Woesearchaeota archaeon]|nr:ABC transporter permease [Candidatus Woesearchaeota archaeon]MCF7901120.1 ABC transporter permease [Candidatus Woesearchaeota archaeon]MCF8012891.1 ABC transporter permease [Candidatus Woesearchaeota archaeon]